MINLISFEKKWNPTPRKLIGEKIGKIVLSTRSRTKSNQDPPQLKRLLSSSFGGAYAHMFLIKKSQNHFLKAWPYPEAC